jgi:hypothetical protein
MVSIPAYDPGAFGTSDFCNSSASLFSQYSESTAVAQKQAKEITLYTEEGDKVTLSMSRQTQAIYSRDDAVGYRQTRAADSSTAVSGEQLVTLESESLELADSRTMTLTIQGDLNKKERADIKKALVQIDRIMMRQLRGEDVLKGVKRAQKVLGLETIAGIEADYSYQAVAYRQETAVMEQQQTVSRGRPRPAFSINHTVDRMADILKASRVDPPKFKSPLRQLFANMNKTIRDRMESNHHAARTLSDLINQTQEQLLARILA